MQATEFRDDLERFQIRLIYLHAVDLCTHDATSVQGPLCGVISCSSTRWPLVESPPYVALSYTWGNLHDTTIIMIDAKQVRVTKNLERALRHLRDRGETSLPWWIDAVCIDQEDEREKTIQVRRMRDIYSRAQTTVSWLGIASLDGCSKLGMRWLQHFGSRASRLGIGKSPEMYLRVLLPQLEDTECHLDNQLEKFLRELIHSLDSEQNSARDDLLAGLRDILGREYWKRVWIVQEIAVATSLQFTCGDDSIDVEALNRGTRLLRNFQRWQETRQLSTTSRTTIRIDPLRTLLLLNIRRKLLACPTLKLLTRLRGSEASDPRDLVFAVLGIASDADTLDISVDYSMTKQELYLHVAVTLLSHGHLSILSSCHGSSWSDLPSWVPDWSKPREYLGLQQWTDDVSNIASPISILRPQYAASSDREANIIGTEKTTRGVLRLRTLILGEIEHISRQGTAGGFTEWIRAVRSMAERATSPLEPIKQRESLWRVAAADQDLWRGSDKPRLSSDSVRKLEAEFHDRDVESFAPESFIKAGLGSYQIVAQNISKGRRPFLISGSVPGIGPADCMPGDVVVIIVGACLPSVLRLVDSQESYRLLGEAYVDGYMDGEGFDTNTSLTTLALL